MPDTHGDCIKEYANGGKIRASWIFRKENIAGIMAKPLPLEFHKYLRDKLMNLKLIWSS